MSILEFLFGKKPTPDNIVVLEKKEYKQAMASQEVQPVDVRTAREFNSGHIPGAINVDFFKPSSFKKVFSDIDKDKPVYLYCQSGNRSLKAAKKLVDMGFSIVYDLKGGYKDWS